MALINEKTYPQLERAINPTHDIKLFSGRSNPKLAQEIADMGISRRARARWLRNVRMQQIATLLSLYVKTVPEGRSFDMAASQLDELFSRAEENREVLPLRGESATAGASLDFMKRLTYGFGMLG